MSFDKKAYDKQYYQDNAEHKKAYAKQYYGNNVEHIKQYRQDNAEHIKIRSKQYNKDNAEHIKICSKQYRLDNPAKRNTYSRKRRALKLGASGFHTEQDLQYIYEQQKGKCVSCGNKFLYEQMTVDHIEPLSKGGPDLPYNIQLLCAPCNSSKGNHHETDYRKFEIDLLRNKSSIRMIFE